MSVILKKKESVAPVEAPVEEMSERQKQALMDAGLMEPEVVKKTVPTWESMVVPTVVPEKKTVVAIAGEIAIGAKVVITNSTFDQWMDRYKSGDTGTVLKVWPAVQEAQGKFRSGIAEIQLDKTREKDHGVCLLHCWELGLAP